MKLFLTLLLSLQILNLFSQKDTLLIRREKVLVSYLNKIRSTQNDQEKKNYNLLFRDYLIETYSKQNSYNYNFTELKTVGFIESPDKEFKIINWNVQLQDESNLFFCLVIRPVNKRKNKIIELIHKTHVYEMPKDYVNESNWYGALYYKIIPIKKGKKTVYTLLGWRSNSNISYMKLIDVIQINGSHAKLGAPIFLSKKEKLKRVVLEYSKKASMTVRYEDKFERIVFDHLSPESPSMNGMYEYYVPDMSYDAYVLQDENWILNEDVIAINSPEKNTYKQVTIDQKTGEIKEEEVKKSWIDPTDPNAPGSPNKHVPALPKPKKK
jgi:hypothetical protein